MTEVTKTDPLVSVVLPTRNSKYLSRAVTSIINQSLTDFELIIISNDETSEFVKQTRLIASVDIRIVLLFEKTRGVVYATNKGLGFARGKYIARMDSDDVAFPTRLFEQVDFLEKNSDIGLVSCLVRYGGSQENGGFIRYVSWINHLISQQQIYLNQFVEFPIVNPSIMFRTSLLKKVGHYYEGDFPEDYEFFLRMQYLGVKMGKVSNYLLSWSDLPERLTKTDIRYSHAAFYKIKAKYLSKWLTLHNAHHPNIYVWGAGRLSRRRSDFLLENGLNIVKYIDFEENKSSNVISFEMIPNPDQCFVVSYVSNWGAREKIMEFLCNKGFVVGKTFILAA